MHGDTVGLLEEKRNEELKNAREGAWKTLPASVDSLPDLSPRILPSSTHPLPTYPLTRPSAHPPTHSALISPSSQRTVGT